ncbi:helix-turn-helix transcriptional regulator [Stenotrophomonas rhizophila]|uniref:helix-turn-helix transcriptional regulator n=1 Tax=Stenotrophomonas rhizophila TaxID=216778 RepID=UPI001E4CC16E|nr:AraC family transcriptional regulator [Stenotrophomonas rhizophila]MCC7633642.1 helix-turn-helix transcriptional regulator [Stenotrophomonas rhizophila]MCC7663588.1 helix-turn-helix transcriptional regulator [Stenotrophomonas rhizophila]
MTCRDAADPIAARLLAEGGGVRADACRGTADGSVALLRQPFAAAAGPMGQGCGLRIGLLVGGGGPLYQRSALGRIEQPWPVGAINVVLPDCPGEFDSPPLDLLGLVVDGRHLVRHAAAIAPGDLHAAAARLHTDPVVTAVMWALWQCADAHAGSRAFFDHGVAVILQRLQCLGGTAAPRTAPPRALSAARLARVQAFIDSRLGEDLSVACMARVAGQDSSSFSRSFRQATGMTPYVFLTRRRMQAAQRLLRAGHSVTATALAVGYANPSKFAAAFRRVTGQAPSAWGRAADDAPARHGH